MESLNPNLVRKENYDQVGGKYLLTRGASGYSSLSCHCVCHSFIHSLCHLTGLSSFLHVVALQLSYEQTCPRVLAKRIEMIFPIKA